MNILVIDDDPLVGRALARLLRRTFEVEVACNPEEALAVIAAHIPDVILCDYELERGTSAAFLEQVAREHPHVRRVLYSASAPELWQPLLDRTIIHVAVMKPAPSEELLKALQGP